MIDPETMNADDPALLERVVQRDPAALSEVFDRYGRIVFGTLHQMLPGPAVANEVCQEVFLRFWRAADSSREQGTPLHHLLLRITGNAATDWLRTHGTTSVVGPRRRVEA